MELKFTKNSDKFRQAAITFNEVGSYCTAPSGTTEFETFWDTEEDRCLNGYMAEDGDWISGYFYFYLNYCRILLVNKKIVIRKGKEIEVEIRSEDFPRFWDSDRAYYDAIELAEIEGRHLVVLKARGRGYQQPDSELLITPDGPISMGNIKKGDYLIGRDGIKTKVLEKIPQGIDDVYEIEFSDKRKVKCGAEHLWGVYNTKNNYVVLQTRELITKNLKQHSQTNKSSYSYRIPEINPISFNINNKLPITPYLLGLLIGDGCICRSPIKFSTEDIELIDKIKIILKDKYSITKDKWDEYGYKIISNERKINKLKRQLKELKLEVKSYDKFIPDIYKYSSIEDRFNLIKGLFDTDGSISIKGTVTYISSSEKLVDDITWILRSLGIRCLKSKTKEGGRLRTFPNGKTSLIRDNWVITVTTYKQIFSLKRKVDRLEKRIKERKFKNQSRIGIKSINKLDYKEKSSCVYVDNKDHLYLTNNLIPTHNSWKGGSMLVRNLALIPKSKSYAVASEMEFLTKDGLLTKAWDILSFINQNTAWSKRMSKIDTKTHKRASFIDDYDDTEKGFKSEIIGVTLKNDPQKARGKRGKLILFEEAGKFPGLLESWQIARPSVEQGSFATGLMIAFGTGGTQDANYESLKELFYSPLAYNVLSFENIFDHGAIKPCGFFVPEYVNMEGVNSKGESFMDKDGNSNIQLAIEEAKKERQLVLENANDKNAVDRYIAEHPFCLHKDTWVSIKGKKENIELQRIKDVKNKFSNGIQDIYKLKTENNRELLCTNTHHIYNGNEYKPLSDYKIGDNIKLLPFCFNKKYQSVEIKYPIANLSVNLKIDEDWGKFLGLFMGDGSFYNPTLEFALDIRDTKTIEWVKKFIVKKSLGNPIAEDIGGMTRIRISKKALFDLFKQLGIIYRSCEKGRWRRKVHVPEYIIKSPKKVIASFLSGLFDTDGSITKTQGAISMYTKYEDFSKDIIMLLTGFGIYSKYKKQEKFNSFGRNYIGRTIGIRKVHNLIFLKDIGFISKRKQTILENTLPVRSLDKDWSFDIIKSIEYYGRDEVYNMQTDTKYYSANGIHTHNSPMEACLQIAGNIFPKQLLMDQLVYLQTNRSAKNAGQCGRLEWISGGLLEWKTGEGLKAIEKFPLDRADKTTGAIQIWEHPYKDEAGKVPPFLYIAATDPYDQDRSESGSLGSTLIYKRFQNFEENYDFIVAEYTARPPTANEYYENVRKLLTYYNAINLYENEKMGIYQYFVTKQCTHLLADQPEIIHEIIKDSHVRRNKGIHMVTKIKDYGEGKLKDWLNEEYAPGMHNVRKLYSIPLIKELIGYYEDGNFDRVIAFLLLMIYNKELHSSHVRLKNKSTKEEGFFPDVIFTNKVNFID